MQEAFEKSRAVSRRGDFGLLRVVCCVQWLIVAFDYIEVLMVVAGAETRIQWSSGLEGRGRLRGPARGNKRRKAIRGEEWTCIAGDRTVRRAVRCGQEIQAGRARQVVAERRELRVTR